MMYIERRVVCELLEERSLCAFGDTVSAWGTSGKAVTQLGTAGQIDALVVSGGKVYAAGNNGVVRYTTSGAVDTPFAQSGELPTSGILPNALLVDEAQNIYLAGQGPGQAEVVRRYKANGTIDSSYGIGGDASLADIHDFILRAVSQQSDGKVVILGTVPTKNNGSEIRVYRLKTTGKLDATFGSNGVVSLQLGTSDVATPVVVDSASAVRVLSSGKIVVSGLSYSYKPPASLSSSDDLLHGVFGDAHFVACRLTSSGALDSTYGNGGIGRGNFENGTQMTQFFQTELTQITENAASTIDAEGNIVIAGRGESLESMKFDAAGNIVFHSVPQPGFPIEVARNMVQLPDGRYVVSGLASAGHATHGPVLGVISSNGEIGPWRSTDDLIAGAPELDGFTASAALAVNTDGNVLIGGSATSGGYMVQEVSAGKSTDARPDDFAGGQTNSLIRDSENNLDVAYFDATSRDLKFVRRLANGAWGRSVAVDSSTDAGVYVSIAVTSKGQPRIAYFDGAHGDLRFASSKDDGKHWTLTTVDSKGSTGLYPSLHIGSNDVASIAYYNKSTSSLTFASQKADGTWGFTTVDADGDVGRSPSLFESDDTQTPIIAYADTSHNAIKCATYAGKGHWGTETVTVTKAGTDFISGAYQDNYQPAIVYYDANKSDLGIAFRGPNKKWQVSTLVTKGTVGLYNTVVLSGGQVYAFTYNRTSDTSLFIDDTGVDQSQAAASDGGKFLAAYSRDSWTDLAYYDAAKRVLQVRSGPFVPLALQ